MQGQEFFLAQIHGKQSLIGLSVASNYFEQKLSRECPGRPITDKAAILCIRLGNESKQGLSTGVSQLWNFLLRNTYLVPFLFTFKHADKTNRCLVMFLSLHHGNDYCILCC